MTDIEQAATKTRTPTQLKKAMGAVNRRLTEIAAQPPAITKGFCMELYRAVIAGSLSIGDFPTALKAGKELAALANTQMEGAIDYDDEIEDIDI